MIGNLRRAKAYLLEKAYKLKEKTAFIDKTDVAFFCAFLLLALALRLSLFEFESGDYLNYLKPWYEYIVTHGRFRAFADNFSDYNPAYLYLLSLATLLPLKKLFAIKTLSIIFDFLLAFFGYLIAHRRSRNKHISAAAFFAILFAPTVFLNSALWAQADAIFTTFAIASIYFFMRGKPAWGAVMYGVCFALKLQAIFLAPLLAILFLKNKMRLRHFFWIVAVFLLSLVPSAIAGRPILELLTIYTQQADKYHMLSFNAPTVYAFVTNDYFKIFNAAGMALAAAATLSFVYAAYKSKEALTDRIIIEISLASTLLVPFLLPKMHERYFFMADIFAILYAFYFPKRFWVPITVVTVSLFSYSPFLFGREVLPFVYLSLALGATLVFVLVKLAGSLYRPALSDGSSK